MLYDHWNSFYDQKYWNRRPGKPENEQEQKYKQEYKLPNKSHENYSQPYAGRYQPYINIGHGIRYFIGECPWTGAEIGGILSVPGREESSEMLDYQELMPGRL